MSMAFPVRGVRGNPASGPVRGEEIPQSWVQPGGGGYPNPGTAKRRGYPSAGSSLERCTLVLVQHGEGNPSPSPAGGVCPSPGAAKG